LGSHGGEEMGKDTVEIEDKDVAELVSGEQEG